MRIVVAFIKPVLRLQVADDMYFLRHALQTTCRAKDVPKFWWRERLVVRIENENVMVKTGTMLEQEQTQRIEVIALNGAPNVRLWNVRIFSVKIT